MDDASKRVRLIPLPAFIVGLLMAMQVSAEVVAGSADGFISEHQLIVPVNPDQAYCALTRDIAQRYKAYLSDK